MKKRNLICVLLAALMLTSLSGCGGSSTADKGTDGESSVSRRDRDDDDDDDDSKDDDEDSKRGDADDSASGDDKTDDSRDGAETDSSKAPADSTSDPVGSAGGIGNQSEYDAAKATLETFFDAVLHGDRDSMLESSDWGLYFEMFEMLSEYDDDIEDINEMLYEAIEDMFDGLGDAASDITITVGNGALRKDLVEAYKKGLAEAIEEYEEMYELYGDDEDAEEYDLYMQILGMYPSIEKIYVFPATVTNKGETNSGYFMVAYENGAWKVDTIFISQTVDYSQKYTIYTANFAARSVYSALMSALVDMDCDDLDLDLITGKTYTFKGSDFEDLTEPKSKKTAEELLQTLKFYTELYYDSITELDEISFILETDYTFPAVAVQSGTMLSMTTESGEVPVFGSYPSVLTADDLSASLTLEAVLAMAKAEYNN